MKNAARPDHLGPCDPDNTPNVVASRGRCRRPASRSTTYSRNDLMDLTMIQRAVVRVSAGLMLSAAIAAPAFAQSVQLTESNDTVIRGGSYANTNFSKDLILATRASDDDTYDRRILLKFDTQNTIPANSEISSAKLTMTVAGGNSESRTISAYRIAYTYEEAQSTWKVRKTGYAWG